MAFQSHRDRRADIANALLAWYDCHRRDLPWRAPPGECTDPYKVWLSEIMLQQTTVAAVKPYFEAFLSRWPNVAHLSQASRDEVLRQWAGLGYYSRAHNLHACAKIVAEKLDGTFPVTETALLRLPGVGPYTAAAIAAIAFGQPAAAVDGNIERVVARLFAIKTPLPGAKTSIRAKARQLVPRDRPGDFTQAMMDLGAILCTPRNPCCNVCPLRNFCLGHASGDVVLPRKAARPKRPIRQGAIFIVEREDGAVLVRSRPPKGLLGGMAEFPGTAWERHFDARAAIRHAPVEAVYRKLEHKVAHSFTHFALTLEIYVAEVPDRQRAPAGCRFVPRRELDREAFPSVMRKVIEAVRFDEARGQGSVKPLKVPSTEQRQEGELAQAGSRRARGSSAFGTSRLTPFASRFPEMANHLFGIVLGEHTVCGRRLHSITSTIW
jgi:A/G-specific adenine glycosylase